MHDKHGDRMYGSAEQLSLVSAGSATSREMRHRPGGRELTWRLYGGCRVGWRWYVVVCALSWLCYVNALGCGFVFDDASAIRDNRDLRPSTPIGRLFVNDFWGTPIHKEQSHKSYRPLCVLTFRLNYWLHELRPIGIPHGERVSSLASWPCFFSESQQTGVPKKAIGLPPGPSGKQDSKNDSASRVCSTAVPLKASVTAALLFAVHPVHTEAVTGVVGRAESLSSVFFLLAFLAYDRAIGDSKRTEWHSLAMCVALVVLATLSKEQGITVVAICFVYEIFIVQQIRPNHVVQVLRSLPWNAVCASPSSTKLASSSAVVYCGWQRECLLRIGTISLSAFLLMAIRLHIMGAQLPVFTKFDNPAAVSASPVRQLTFHYLPAVNVWLLLFPHALCCDWTMGSVALVRTLSDPRNAATLSLYTMLAVLAYVTLLPTRRPNELVHQNVIFLSLSLLVFPFLPASNLFFPVGFVIAERVLYMPSMGFCLLVAHGWHLMLQNYAGRRLTKNFLWFGLLCLLTVHSLKTFVRNFEWESEYSIFMAGLKVNSQNAKLYNNVGHALEGQGDYARALEYFLKAASVQPDDIGAHMNVGRTYNNLLMFEEAEAAFHQGDCVSGEVSRCPNPERKFRTRHKFGVKKVRRTLVANFKKRSVIPRNPQDATLFASLAEVVEATTEGLATASVVTEPVQSPSAAEPSSSGRVRLDTIYRQQSDLEEEAKDLLPRPKAGEPYKARIAPNHLNVFLNLANLISRNTSRLEEADGLYRQAISMRVDYIQAYINRGDILIKLNRTKEAQEVYEQALSLDATNPDIFYNLGVVILEQGRPDDALMYFNKALELDPDHEQALMNSAILIQESGNSKLRQLAFER
ncbi:hypothetical protein MRX96_002983 [Rhipicephalus microplus]